MNRPDDIPEDIWAAAERVGEAIHGRHERGWVAWPLITDSGTDGPQKIVARALLAERERCAKVAEEHAKAKWGGPDMNPTVAARTAALSIAALIREGDE